MTVKSNTEAGNTSIVPSEANSRCEALGTDPSYQEIFLKAVRNGDTGELQSILQRWEGSVNVNFYDQTGQTALHQSCMNGNLELVKLLVKFGADARLANRDGWSALHIAAYGGHRDIALYLIANAHR
ncbi:notch-regulated ankyrin repeat-containing protein-like [Limulus polyphemus]|uniref:Notch-regulated ankyrin repeat-containing protein-like n=1 Tax=Limulus polyphemus TaxID=6850 RepID=A0ABM1C405_LIMPO|nr:notch-regulated ankyrin repeat-containing protein-like [Limulus polyphemus]